MTSRTADLRHLFAHLRFTPKVFVIALVSFVTLFVVLLWVSDLPGELSRDKVRWWLLLAALVVGGLQYVGDAISLGAATRRTLSPGRLLELEVAEALTLVLTPESVGSLALSLRYLQRTGMDSASAAAATGLSSFLTTAAAAIVLPVAAVFAASSVNVAALRKEVPSSLWVVIVVCIAAAALVTAVVKLPGLRHRVAAWFRKAGDDMRTVLAHPTHAAAMLAGELVCIAAVAGCMALLLTALDQPVNIAAVIVITQIAGAASNVVPVPGGLGAPEAIIVAGLTSVGVGHAEAVVVALSYRLCVYWLPTLPGLVALYDLQRRQLV